jgi:hypothetical protein
VLRAIDLNKNEPLFQNQEIDSPTSDHWLKLIVNLELFQELRRGKIQDGIYREALSGT